MSLKTIHGYVIDCGYPIINYMNNELSKNLKN